MSASTDSKRAAVPAAVDAVLTNYPDRVAAYHNGHGPAFGFLVGQAMKLTAGESDARLVNEELRRRLEPRGGSR